MTMNPFYFVLVTLSVLLLLLADISTSSSSLSFIEDYLENPPKFRHHVPQTTTDACPAIVPELVVACASPEHSCRNQCGLHSAEQGVGLKTCSCDRYCRFFQDCCVDFDHVCPEKLVNESKYQSEQKFKSTCIQGYSAIDTCPPTWDYGSNESLALAERVGKYFHEKLLTDLNTGLPYRNFFYLNCNGIVDNNTEEWNYTLGYRSKKLFQNDHARTCLFNTFLFCNDEFKIVEPGCNFFQLQFGIRSVCQLFTNKETRQEFISFVINSRAGNGDVPSISSGGVDNADELLRTTSLVDLDKGVELASSLYQNSCYAYTALEKGSDHLRGTFSTLFSIAGLRVVSESTKGLQFFSWCASDSSAGSGGDDGKCIQKCRKSETRHEKKCQQITTVDFQIIIPKGTGQMDPSCLPKFYNHFVFEVLKKNAFLDFGGHVVFNPYNVSVQFRVNKEIAQQEMKDPYFRNELYYLQKKYMSYEYMKLEIDVKTIGVCLNENIKLCKMISLFHEYQGIYKTQESVGHATKNNPDTTQVPGELIKGKTLANTTRPGNGYLMDILADADGDLIPKKVTILTARKNEGGDMVSTFLAYPTTEQSTSTTTSNCAFNDMSSSVLITTDLNIDLGDFMNTTNAVDRKDDFCACDMEDILLDQDYTCVDFTKWPKIIFQTLLKLHVDFDEVLMNLHQINSSALCFTGISSSNVYVYQCCCNKTVDSGQFQNDGICPVTASRTATDSLSTSVSMRGFGVVYLAFILVVLKNQV